MMVKTVSEWEIYIGKLAGSALRSKVITANTQRFVDSLRADGMSMVDVSAVIRMFIRQLAATGQAIPSGGVYDMPTIAETDPVAMLGISLDPRTITEMVANPPEEESLADKWDGNLYN
jgi:hypothetical protein